MKKTFSVNLGNRVYNIDDDAYLRLKEYLDRIESYFSDEKEREDIINDIEMRLSELFSERLSASRQVITLADVTETIRIMGDPSEIGGAKGKSEPYRTHERHSTRRRLYRDPEGRARYSLVGDHAGSHRQGVHGFSSRRIQCHYLGGSKNRWRPTRRRPAR
jgi:hypothetical protein